MESWTLRYFAQANPEGPTQGDVPSLLRRVADSIAELGAVEVQDVVLHCAVTADGPWWSAAVYFHAAEGSHRA